MTAGGRRLDNPEDFVRMEIGTALKRRIRVIPVLVDRALMPAPTDLPDDLKLLVRRNALRITDTSFDGDCQRLADAIKQVFDEIQTRGWRAELVSKGWSRRTIRVWLSNDVHLIEFSVGPRGHTKVIKVDAVVVAKAGSVLTSSVWTWQPELPFRIYDGDIEYAAVMQIKAPYFARVRQCRLLVDGRLLYTDEQKKETK
jgi:hypothetical protein